MKGRELTRDEAKRLAASVHEVYGYLSRLKERMVAAGIAVETCHTVEGVANRVHGLWVEFHYASCRRANEFDFLDK